MCKETRFRWNLGNFYRLVKQTTFYFIFLDYLVRSTLFNISRRKSNMTIINIYRTMNHNRIFSQQNNFFIPLLSEHLNCQQLGIVFISCGKNYTYNEISSCSYAKTVLFVPNK